MNPCRIHTQEHHHDSNLVVYCYTFDQLLALIFTDQFAGIRVICTRSSSSISAVDVSMVMILTSIVRLSLIPCKMFLIHIRHDEFHRKYFVYLPGGGPIPPPPILVGALWPRHESRLGPSFVSASEPSGLERSLKNAPPVTARPTVPRRVSVKEEPWKELMKTEHKILYHLVHYFCRIKGHCNVLPSRTSQVRITC